MGKLRIHKSLLTGLLAFACLVAAMAGSGPLRIGLFYDYQVRSVVISPEADDICLLVDGQSPAGISGSEMLYVSMVAGRLYIQGARGGSCQGLQLVTGSRSGRGEFGVQPLDNPVEKRIYRGQLQIVPGIAGLGLILHAGMNDYLSGVVKTEGGYETSPEFYKAQAVLCRTYACKHIGKHEEEGFDLCDCTHCQAFKGMIPADHPISLSVYATDGLVVVDSSGQMITAGFHSNCGGETAAGSDVWIGEMPYMQPVTDPYCRQSRNASWTVRIPLDDWIRYLDGWCNGSEEGKNMPPPEFIQNERKKYYPCRGMLIPLKTIREDWNLRSGFFSLRIVGTEVVLEGRGNGHGAGMCQEGAMKMAEAGYNFQDLIRFYFKGVTITKLPGP